MVRKLTLKSERLTDLGTDELRDVVGAGSGTTCIGNPSEIAISLCGCFTNYCSIDIC